MAARLSSAWFPPPRVGGTVLGGVAELGKEGIQVSDSVVRDLHIPIMTEALELQDGVFAIADELGVGAEVRAAVLTIRGAEYANVLAAGVLPSGAAAAGAGVLTGIGGVAALGAIAVVGAVLLELLGGGDDEEQTKRTKRAQAATLHLRDRLTLEEFAAEQDATAGATAMLVPLATALPNVGLGSPAQLQAASARAQKLAAFYRAADAQLSTSGRALFESLSNLARWQSAIVQYEAMIASKRNAVDVLLGKSASRLNTQLRAKIEEETERTHELVQTVQGERSSSLALGLGLAGVAGAGALALFAPTSALGLVAWIARAAAAAYSRAKGLLP
jgi:hypothetical protein